MAIYQWTERLQVNTKGVSLNAELDAQPVGEQVAAIIERDGGITPDAFVHANKSADSVAHAAFEWDGRRAAHKYRCQQAGLILRKLRVVYAEVSGEQKTVRAFSSVTDDGRGRKYVSTETAMREPDRRDEILMQALNQLRTWRRRWSELNEYADALTQVDAAIDAMRSVVAASE